MLKSLRNKIRTLNKTQFNILTVVLVLINIGILAFWISFWINLKRPPALVKEKPVLEKRPIEEVLKNLTAPKREEPLSPEEERQEKQRLKKILENLTAPLK